MVAGVSSCAAGAVIGAFLLVGLNSRSGRGISQSLFGVVGLFGTVRSSDLLSIEEALCSPRRVPGRRGGAYSAGGV